MNEDEENYPRKSSLALTCFKILFGLYTFCTVIITIIQMYATYSKAEESILKEAQSTFKSISEALTLGVHGFDNKLVIKLLDGLVNTPQIRAAVIVDEENLTYIAKGIKKEKDGKLYETKTYPGLVKISKDDLFHKDDFLKKFSLKVGTIYIYRAEDSILERVKDGFYYLIIAAFLKTVCLGFIFFWVFKKWLMTPLSNLINHAESINLNNLKKISLGLSPLEKNELHILEGSLNEMIESIQLSKKEVDEKNDQLSESYRNLFGLSEELKKVNERIVEKNINLEDKVIETNKELNLSFRKTEAMLLNVNKAIFITDSKGIVQPPVSKHCEILFHKDIIGENGLKLLFFHLKDNSKEKELILKAWRHIFGQDKSHFLSVESNFPKSVVHPDIDQKKGRHLKISYAPLFDKNEKLNYLMFLVEDVTKEMLEKLQVKKEVQYYHIIMNILPISNKVQLVESLTKYLKICVIFLEDIVGTEAEKEKHLRDSKNLEKIIAKGQEKNLKPIDGLQFLLKKFSKDIQMSPGGIELFSVNVITQIIESLNAHLEVFKTLNKNMLGPEVNYTPSKKFESSIEEKIQDLHRLMTNILEYVFLVRKLEDLDKEKIDNAPKKARLYSEFDRIIELLMKRSLLISYLLKVTDEVERSQAFYNLSNLLKQMPSKDKLTEAALVNHLVNPYADIQKA